MTARPTSRMVGAILAVVALFLAVVRAEPTRWCWLPPSSWSALSVSPRASCGGSGVVDRRAFTEGDHQ